MRSALNCKVLEEPKYQKQSESIKRGSSKIFSHLPMQLSSHADTGFLPGYCLVKVVATTFLQKHVFPETMSSLLITLLKEIWINYNFKHKNIQQIIYRTCNTSYDLPKTRTPYVPSLALEGREFVLCGGWLQLVSGKSPARLWLRSRLRRP